MHFFFCAKRSRIAACLSLHDSRVFLAGTLKIQHKAHGAKVSDALIGDAAWRRVARSHDVIIQGLCAASVPKLSSLACSDRQL